MDKHQGQTVPGTVGGSLQLAPHLSCSSEVQSVWSSRATSPNANIGAPTSNDQLALLADGMGHRNELLTARRVSAHHPFDPASSRDQSPDRPQAERIGAEPAGASVRGAGRGGGRRLPRRRSRTSWAELGEDELRQRHEKRLWRNRVSAKKSRDRKRELACELEQQVEQQLQYKSELQKLIASLLWENENLRRGVNVPPVKAPSPAVQNTSEKSDTGCGP